MFPLAGRDGIMYLNPNTRAVPLVFSNENDAHQGRVSFL